MQRYLAAVVLGLSLFTSSAMALPRATFIVLTPKEIKNVIGNFPQPGSVDEAADVEALLKLQESRTEADCKAAAAQVLPTVGGLFGDVLTKKEVKRLNIKLLNSYSQAVLNQYIAKRTFKRPRPFTSHPQIKPCILREPSYSYPSGHSTLARVLGRMISKIYPEKAEAIMKKADEAAHHRMVGGVHYPTDIQAGKKLGDYLADKIMADQDFQKALDSTMRGKVKNILRSALLPLPLQSTETCVSIADNL